MIEAYPLHWPIGYPRTQNPQRNYNFHVTSVDKQRKELLHELKLLGAKDVIISTNIPLRQDGLPYSDWQKRRITDKGVAVYFTLDGQQNVLCCDAWDLIEDNMRALVLTIDAMRGIGRWKVSEVLKRTFTGFKALPEATLAEKDIWKTLGLDQKPQEVAAVHSAYKKKAWDLHPDRGGSQEAFQQLQEAYKKALTFF